MDARGLRVAARFIEGLNELSAETGADFGLRAVEVEVGGKMWRIDGEPGAYTLEEPYQ